MDRMSDIRNPSEKDLYDKRFTTALNKFKGMFNLHFPCLFFENHQFAVTVLTVRDIQRPGRPKLAKVKKYDDFMSYMTKRSR